MSRAQKKQEQKAGERATRRLACLVSGLGAGAAFITWRLMHPLLGAILWLCALALTLYGIPWLVETRWPRRLLRLAACVLAVSLWYVTSHHADLRIIKSGLAAKTDDPSKVGIYVYLKNEGQWRVYYAPAQGMQLIRRDIEPTMRRSTEEALYAMVDAKRYETELYELADGQETILPVRIDVTPEQRAAFDAGRTAFLVVLQLRYRDWFPKEEVFEQCLIVPASGPTLLCARHNGRRQTWWLF
jgi:hypothetical protein